MHQVNDAIVHGGKVVLSHLPFADGQRVRILVAETDAPRGERRTIAAVRELLKNGVERFDEPHEPMIPIGLLLRKRRNRFEWSR